MERGSRGRGRPRAVPRGRGRPHSVSQEPPPPPPRGRGRSRPRARGAGRGGAPRGGHEDSDDGERHSSSDSETERRPLFLRAYDEERVQPHRLGPCNAVCEKCGARCWLEERAQGKTWGGETSCNTRPLFVDCCKNGAVQLPLPQEPPPELRILLIDDSVVGLERRRNLRQYNAALAFTSVGVKRSDHSDGVDRSVWGPMGIYTYRIRGRCYHRMGSLLPDPDKQPAFAQIFFAGDDASSQAERRATFHDRTEPMILERLGSMIERVNPYYEAFLTFRDRMRDSDEDAQELQLTIVDPKMKDPRTYNRPTSDEVACIYIGPEDAQSAGRDVVVHLRGGGLRRFNELHPAFQTLHFTLLFVYGEQGWHPHIPLAGQEIEGAVADDDGAQDDGGGHRPVARTGRGGSKRVSRAQHAAYYLYDRCGIFSTLLNAGPLLQELLCDVWAQTEADRLRWVLMNQETLRTDSYKGLMDAVHAGVDLDQIGKRVILPSSFSGSPRQMHAHYQDAMAIVTYATKPDLFVTFTMNPNSPEVLAELRYGQQPHDRPDLLARVFELKLDALLHDLIDLGVLGKVIAHVWVVEYQKRGLPHTHLLSCLRPEDKPRTPEDVDRLTRATLPDPDTEPELFRIVTSSMLHSCGPRCQDEDGKCTKGYPRPFKAETRIDKDGYPEYARPDNGRTFIKKVNGRDFTFSNQHVVPYNPALSRKYGCHINVEVCTSVRAVKYLFKYVYKGHDRANVVVSPAGVDRDEVKEFQDARWISACEAFRRILGHRMHGHYPPVQRLQLHLPQEDEVRFIPEDDPAAVAARADLRKDTTLTGFFKACAAMPDLMANVLYADAPRTMTWDNGKRTWNVRRSHFNIGRVYFAGPSSGERYYLRRLLYHVRCPTSFEFLRTVEDTTHPTFKAACIALGLLEDDGDLHDFLTQIGDTATARQLRRTFATILCECQPAEPLKLWRDHRVHICDDCRYMLIHRGLRGDPTEEEIYSLGLQLLGEVLEERGRSLASVYMPEPSIVFDISPESRVIREETSYDQDELRVIVDRAEATANEGQRAALDEVLTAVALNENVPHGSEVCEAAFFLDGPGGTGKTFVENAIAAILRLKGKIVIMVGSSGICAILLKGGRTAHSRFNIPIELFADTSLNVPKQTELAELFRRTALIIWDEAPMQHRHCAESVDRMLQDVRSCKKLFGGVVVLFGGDFRQCLPVVLKGSQSQIKDACLTSSYIWDKVRVLRLIDNMRLQSVPMTHAERVKALAFGVWLKRVGDGLHDGADRDAVRVPAEHIVKTDDELFDFAYPNLGRPFASEDAAMSYFVERALLAPTNADVDDLNRRLIGRLPKDAYERTFFSADSVLETDSRPAPNADQQLWPIEYLNSITVGGYPLHVLKLKVGCTILLLRNLDPGAGLCNGTRLLVTRLQPNAIHGRILGGDFHGNEAYIMRVGLDTPRSAGLPFILRRRQMPVRVGLALSINKSQGQSLGTVGLYLKKPVFTHGQFYVGASRAKFPHGLKIRLEDSDEGARGETKNIVYKDVLLAAAASH